MNKLHAKWVNLIRCGACQPMRPHMFFLAIIFFALPLAFVWFYYVIDPWQGIINGDHAVPYRMATAEFRVQDFYFWKAARFGSLYVLFMKTFVIPFTGNSADAYILGHVIFFFIGLTALLAATPHWLGRIVMLWVFLPFSDFIANHFLFAGHLYGMVFFLQSIFLYIFMVVRSPSLLLYLAGTVAGLAYWQHQVVGSALCGIIAVYVGYQWRAAGWQFKTFRNFSVMALIGFLPLLVLSEFARMWSRRWSPDNHYGIASSEQIFATIENLMTKGLPYANNEVFALIVFWGSISLSLYGAWLLFMHLRKSRYPRENVLVGFPMKLETLFVSLGPIMIASILIIVSSVWFYLNGADQRYFFILQPLTLFCFCLLLIHRKSFVRSGVTVLLLVLAFFAQRSLHNAFDDWTLSDNMQRRYANRVSHLNRQVQILEQMGCTNYLDGYWQAQPLPIISERRIVVASLDYNRNPEVLESIILSEKFCYSPRFQSWIDVHVKPRGFHECEFKDGFGICRSHST